MTDQRENATRSMSLSLRLLREGRTVESALRDGHELEERPSEAGRLFVGQTRAVPPTWFDFISSFATGGLRPLVSQSCAAVLFLEGASGGRRLPKRILAITFGTAYHSLDPDAFERRFGLKVVLNAVARSNLRSLDIATLDATTFQKRIQASRDADLQGFGIDIDRDLLRLASGSPRDSSFARSLAGKDALTLHTRTSPADLFAKCEAALSLYQAEDYKMDFGFIDFVMPVRQHDLLVQLDAAVFSELQLLVSGKASDLHLTLPDILSPEESIEVGYFGIGLKSGRKQAYTQVAIEDYVDELRDGQIVEIADMAELRASHEIRVINDGEGDKKQKRKLYDCFVYELAFRGDIYVLFAGDWFVVDKSFHASVEKDFLKLLAKKPFVATTKTHSEREFIAELDAHRNLLNLDQVKLSPASAPGSNLEPCDFLSITRQFIHLKDGHSSAPISHLWNQGVVSAESFVRDEQFRIELRKEVKKRQAKFSKSGFDAILPDGRSRPVPSEFTVVFGIMRDRYRRSGAVSIPFFSKVSLRAVADRIQLMGFPVEVHLVERI